MRCAEMQCDSSRTKTFVIWREANLYLTCSVSIDGKWKCCKRNKIGCTGTRDGNTIHRYWNIIRITDNNRALHRLTNNDAIKFHRRDRGWVESQNARQQYHFMRSAILRLDS